MFMVPSICIIIGDSKVQLIYTSTLAHADSSARVPCIKDKSSYDGTIVDHISYMRLYQGSTLSENHEISSYPYSPCFSNTS
jgi:hypothetical protein